jgi:mRNA interferase MazF
MHFPFTDLSGQKLRPALIVGEPTGDDLIVAFITSHAPGFITPAEYVLDPGSVEFRSTGLKASSVVRLNTIATLHRTRAPRRIGRIGPQTEAAVARSLRYVFHL